MQSILNLKWRKTKKNLPGELTAWFLGWDYKKKKATTKTTEYASWASRPPAHGLPPWIQSRRSSTGSLLKDTKTRWAKEELKRWRRRGSCCVSCKFVSSCKIATSLGNWLVELQIRAGPFLSEIIVPSPNDAH